MALIRYAGWDPTDEAGHRSHIDEDRALELRLRRRMKWREVAAQLALESGNEVTYAADAVAKAARRAASKKEG